MLSINLFQSKLYFFLSMYNCITLVLILCWANIFTLLITTQYARHKFVLFFFNIIFFIIWGFYLNLDGIMLLFLLAELMLLFIFFLLYTQITLKIANPVKFNIHIVRFLFSFLLILIFLDYSNINDAYSWVDYYASQYTIVAADFFFIYVFFFVNYPILVILIGILLGIFSLFFIFLFFIFKQTKIKETKINNKLFFLRKQQFTKQANYKSPIRTFQKKFGTNKYT